MTTPIPKGYIQCIRCSGWYPPRSIVGTGSGTLCLACAS